MINLRKKKPSYKTLVTPRSDQMIYKSYLSLFMQNYPKKGTGRSLKMAKIFGAPLWAKCIPFIMGGGGQI